MEKEGREVTAPINRVHARGGQEPPLHGKQGDEDTLYHSLFFISLLQDMSAVIGPLFLVNFQYARIRKLGKLLMRFGLIPVSYGYDIGVLWQITPS